ncbi:MAG: gamma-glutamyl-gamma-aminobutyrate hydrolase family protein [Proteobacteria bacterium]|nr:gamma-glutamyl-gamma-aminobutyrate hydrolase family protein [Pseudomonadota bacterium]
MRPVVGITCDRRTLGKHPFHVAGEKYITAVRGGADALPLLLPVLDPPLATGDILDAVDGLLFTGSPSNVHPDRYSGAAPRDGTQLDPHRDATALPLLEAAIALGKPVLCICRGFQELNVAFGGTLHQHVHEVEGRIDHRENPEAPLAEQYGPAHAIAIVEGGMLAGLVPERSFEVNSLHGQGIDRLAAALRVEATAPDGQIEAVSMPAARDFVLAVQWHPEWLYAENYLSRAIFAAFGAALRHSRRP